MADHDGSNPGFDPEAIMAAALAEAQSLVAQRFGEAIDAAVQRAYAHGQRDDAQGVEEVRSAFEAVESAQNTLDARFGSTRVETVPEEDASFDDVSQWLSNHGGDEIVNAAALREEIESLRDAVERLANAVRALAPTSHIREVG